MFQIHIKHLRSLLLIKALVVGLLIYAQNSKQIPANKVVSNKELANYLKSTVEVGTTEMELAAYFRKRFSERYFYDWQSNATRFSEYEKAYKSEIRHRLMAFEHMSLFNDSTAWKLPFNYKSGSEVNAYALRHLARQHKMVDIALMHYYDNKDKKYINYFTTQMRSLNVALESDKYETIKDGNGVYEVFRAGYRVLNWLEIHNLFLGEEGYTDQDQLTTIATLLQHGQNLYENNDKFNSGNHQTKGMSSLVLLAILFQDFEGTDLWYARAMLRLQEHLEKEINDDGFQFERTVHYHMSDINNYYYAYQLAKINKKPISDEWESKLNSLFTTLVKIAYPDKSTPVLSDDTNIPWAEKNDISGTMTLGYLLFDDAQFGYFAEKQIDSKMYWFLQDAQLEKLKNIDTKKPVYKSLSFEDTKYYVMREGYDKNDKMMIISAGVDTEKPDHQHGDILGIQAQARGKIILPNYQVRYSLPDYDLFKNSLVKNVALVDNELQGKEYKGNKGGSGFGKFGKLPIPTTIAWETNSSFDLFIGSHNGFENVGVDYTRQVIYVKDRFWVVKDNFVSNTSHTYKQVWQGHYTPEGSSSMLRSSFDDAVGCDIFQINATDSVLQDGARGKNWSIVSKQSDKNFNFITVIYPYEGYDNRIEDDEKNPKIGGYETNKLKFDVVGENWKSLSKGDESFLFGVSTFNINAAEFSFDKTVDIFVVQATDKIEVQSINKSAFEITVEGCDCVLMDGKKVKGKLELKPAEKLICELKKK